MRLQDQNKQIQKMASFTGPKSSLPFRHVQHLFFQCGEQCLTIIFFEHNWLRLKNAYGQMFQLWMKHPKLNHVVHQPIFRPLPPSAIRPPKPPSWCEASAVHGRSARIRTSEGGRFIFGRKKWEKNPFWHVHTVYTKTQSATVVDPPACWTQRVASR